MHKIPLARFDTVLSEKETFLRIYVNPKPHDQASPLIQAVKSRNLGLIDDLAEIESLRNRKDENGFSALHVAAHLGLRDEAELLLRHNVEIEVVNDQRRTPLAVAVWALNLELVKLLLQHGADQGAVDHGERTSLHLACGVQSAEIVAALVTTNERRVQEVINRRNHRGWTALGRACITGNIEIATLLLDHGADPNVMIYSQQGPLMHLIQEICPDGNGLALLRLLFCYGARLDLLDEEGYTILIRAASRGLVQVCQNLVDVGAGPEVESSIGTNPVSAAARYGHVEIVRLLLRGGARGYPPSGLKSGSWRELDFGSEVTPQLRTEIFSLLKPSTRT
jgi:ankyrin repeat protein